MLLTHLGCSLETEVRGKYGLIYRFEWTEKWFELKMYVWTDGQWQMAGSGIWKEKNWKVGLRKLREETCDCKYVNAK